MKSITKEKLKKLDKACKELPCQDPAKQRNWDCKDCRISSQYESLTGIRMEDLDGADILDK